MKKKLTAEVLVLSAGPAGMMTVILLAEAGIDIQLIEPRDRLCTLGGQREQRDADTLSRNHNFKVARERGMGIRSRLPQRALRAAFLPSVTVPMPNGVTSRIGSLPDRR